MSDPCPHCLRPEGAVNHVPGHIFVGWGHGWQPCPHCGGSATLDGAKLAAEIALVVAVLEHPAGFDLAFAGSLIRIRVTLDATIEVEWETIHDPPSAVPVQHRSFPRAELRDAAAFFVAKRRELQLGADFEVDLRARYLRVMPSDDDLDFDRADARFVLRQWDGMDGCWSDCSDAPVTADEALALWNERTNGGTERVKFSEIDYYRIFPSGTRMHWDGGEGREMFRNK